MFRNLRDRAASRKSAAPNQAKAHSPLTASLPPTRPLIWLNTTPFTPDDRPCTIESLDVQARVVGLYAEVAETLVIANPNPRPLSTSVSLPMPDGAVVYGYALDINGQMVDGVVVPKEKARVAFETEQRRGIDPGLVESVKGNVYRTRVYPVPSRGTRTLRLSYITPLLANDGTSATLNLPMPDEVLTKRTIHIEVEMLDAPAPQVSGLGDARFREAQAFWRAESSEQNITPRSDVRVALPQLPPTLASIERDEDGTVWFAASEAVAAHEPWNSPAVQALTVLWDTSGSRAGVDHRPEFELLRGFAGPDATPGNPLRLITFSNEVDEPQVFESVEALINHLATVRYDGGTDLAKLADALNADAASCAYGPHDVCVLFTDGMDTLADEPLSLPDACNALAIVSGPERDMEALRQACGGRAYDVAAAPKDAAGLSEAAFGANRLTGIQARGVADVIGIGSGTDGRYAIIGQLVADTAEVTLNNTRTQFTLNSADARTGNTLARAWAAQRVSQLSPRADDNEEDLLSLGRRFGVVSSATSLLVLETLDQWLRYDIEPPKTLAQLHRDWEAARKEYGRQPSEEDRAKEHLRRLSEHWDDLRAWWEHDFSTPSESLDDPTIVPCTRCGAPLTPGAVFCAQCGSPVARRADDHPMQIFSAAPNSDITAGFPPVPDSRSTYGDASFAPDAPDASADVLYSMAAPGRMEMADALMAEDMVASAPSATDSEDPADAASAPSVVVQPWSPDAAYLKALDATLATQTLSARDAYFAHRAGYAASPSFFLDCAGWFLAHDDRAFGLRVLSNLSELRIEDAALLRVMAWRLREAGELELAIATLRRVLKLRGEDAQSSRDLSIALDEYARQTHAQGDTARAKELCEEAGEFYRKTALTPWQRHPIVIGTFAVEEYNILRAWAQAQMWDEPPQLPSLGEQLEGVLSCDLRVTLAWDADETDVDLHVTEPSGEEAYFGHNRTSSGGRVSEDITDGYGPECYEIRRAQDGTYAIRAHYYASHQQTVFGPATCTATIYTDWGRPEQTHQVLSMRIDAENEMIDLGKVTYEGHAKDESSDGNEDATAADDKPVAKGSSPAHVLAVYGEPTYGDPGNPVGVWVWALTGGRTRIVTFEDNVVSSIVERLPGGNEMVIV